MQGLCHCSYRSCAWIGPSSKVQAHIAEAHACKYARLGCPFVDYDVRPHIPKCSYAPNAESLTALVGQLQQKLHVWEKDNQTLRAEATARLERQQAHLKRQDGKIQEQKQYVRYLQSLVLPIPLSAIAFSPHCDLSQMFKWLFFGEEWAVPKEFVSVCCSVLFPMRIPWPLQW